MLGKVNVVAEDPEGDVEAGNRVGELVVEMGVVDLAYPHPPLSKTRCCPYMPVPAKWSYLPI